MSPIVAAAIFLTMIYLLGISTGISVSRLDRKLLRNRTKSAEEDRDFWMSQYLILEEKAVRLQRQNSDDTDAADWWKET